MKTTARSTCPSSVVVSNAATNTHPTAIRIRTIRSCLTSPEVGRSSSNRALSCGEVELRCPGGGNVVISDWPGVLMFGLRHFPSAGSSRYGDHTFRRLLRHGDHNVQYSHQNGVSCADGSDRTAFPWSGVDVG